MTEGNYELRDYEKVQEEYEGQSLCKGAAKEIANLREETTTLKAELLSAGTARQELMNDNLRFVEEIAALKEQVAQLQSSAARRFIIAKMQEQEETIDSLQSKSAALEAQVSQLQIIITEEATDSAAVIIERDSLQSKSAALVDALAGILPWVVTQAVRCSGLKCREAVCLSCTEEDEVDANVQKACDAYHKANEALAAFKGEK